MCPPARRGTLRHTDGEMEDIMLVANLRAPGPSAERSPSKPTPTHTQLTWATILLFRKVSDAIAPPPAFG